MEQLLYGAAYYDEYMPCERLEEDVKMWKKAGMNVVRIAESTWSTCEPQEGVFDFTHVTRVLDACEQAGISVIIGTPTYAVPTWLVKKYPDVLAVTKQGQAMYGHRRSMPAGRDLYGTAQRRNMDIRTNVCNRGVGSVYCRGITVQNRT